MSRLNEHDEFLLSRFLDGDLSETESAALKERLEREPDLRSALNAMTRIDGLLAERSQETSRVNWDRFHAQVMDRLLTESAPVQRTLRFPNWLRVAMPIAVAASIALVITLRQQWPDRKESSAPTVRVAYHTPAPAPAGKLVVRYDRHPTRIERDRSGQPSIHVSYFHSKELQDEIQKYDKARENRPLWHLYTVHSDTPEQLQDDFFGLSAL